MELQLTKYYKTRNGNKVRIYAMDGSSVRPVHGAVLIGQEWFARQWRSNGKLYNYESGEDDDIVAEWQEPVTIDGWVNVYDEGLLSISALYVNKSHADNNAIELFRALGKKCIACIKISGSEVTE